MKQKLAVVATAVGLLFLTPAGASAVVAPFEVGSVSANGSTPVGSNGAGERVGLIGAADLDFHRINLSWISVYGTSDGHADTTQPGAASDCATYGGGATGSNTFWCAMDSYVDRIADQGLRINPVLYGAPSVYRAPGETRVASTAAAQSAWTGFVALAISRYGQDGSYWNLTGRGGGAFDMTGFEVWNEPNLAQFWDNNASDSATTDADEYIQLLNAAADGRDYVASAKPKTMLVAPSWTPAGGTLADQWLNRFANAGPHGRYERVSVHPYGISAATVRNKLQQVRTTLPVKKMWATEQGFGVGCVSGFSGYSFYPQAETNCDSPGSRTATQLANHEAAQRDEQQELFNEVADNEPYVESWTYYELLDDSTNPDDPTGFMRFGAYGLRSDGTTYSRPMLNLLQVRAG